jgi:hypothetical protein
MELRHRGTLAHVTLLVVTLALAACGGGGDQKPEVFTGTLKVGGVRGVQFSTPTQAGVTDAGGTFRYVAGETVTFSIGSIVLGSAAGAPEVTLFTLAGLAPPSTELALRRELDRAKRRSTPFTKAMNLQRLLMVLDSDGNAADGFDVSGREQTLAGQTIDVSLRLNAFASQLERRVPNVTRGIPIGRPVVQLYRGIGLGVAGHGATVLDTLDTFGFHDRSTNHYLPDGTLETQITDADGDGSDEFESHYGFDTAGRLLTANYSTDYNGDHDPDYIDTQSVVFDPLGNFTSFLEETDNDGDGDVDIRNAQTGQFDAYGAAAEIQVTMDNNADDNVDLRLTLQNEFDARHNLVRSVLLTDNGDDGTVDARAVTTYTVNARDQLLTQVYENDADNDGLVNERRSDSYEYDAAGFLIRMVQESDYNADGTVDNRGIAQYTVNDSGDVLSRTTTYDDVGNGVVQSTTLVTSTYDADGRVLNSHETEDFETDGNIDFNTDYTYVYDSAGSVMTETRLDQNGQGDPTTYVNSYFYGVGGELTRSQHTSDFESDGIIDQDTGTDVTNVEFADITTLLTQHYFDFYF